jgi:hypothetical protein
MNKQRGERRMRKSQSRKFKVTIDSSDEDEEIERELKLA